MRPLMISSVLEELAALPLMRRAAVLETILADLWRLLPIEEYLLYQYFPQSEDLQLRYASAAKPSTIPRNSLLQSLQQKQPHSFDSEGLDQSFWTCAPVVHLGAPKHV